MARVFERERTFADMIYHPIERLIYKLTGIASAISNLLGEPPGSDMDSDVQRLLSNHDFCDRAIRTRC